MHCLKSATNLFVRHHRGPLSASRSIAHAGSKLIVEKENSGGVATVYMNNPPVNLLDADMLKRFTGIIQSLEGDSEVRGIIVTSRLDGQVFTGGMNILEVYKKTRENIADFTSLVQDFHMAYYGCKKPIVACINGQAPAGGCFIALMSDYRVMYGGSKTSIGFNEVHMGLAPTYSFSDLMVRTIGQRSTEKAILRGKMFSAEEALQTGLIDAVGELKDLNDMATKALKGYTAINAEAFAVAKMNLRQDHINHLRRTKDEEKYEFADRLLKPDVQESIGKYLAMMSRR